MKYRIFTIGLAAGLFAACSVNEMDINTPIDGNEEFFASIEDASTKVFVDDNLKVLWHADDRVSIFNKYTYNQEYRFTGKTGANSGSFKKVPNDDFITGNALDLVYAVYPYQESTEISNQGVLTLDLPATHLYAENSFGTGANTMVSCSEGNELLFKNLCGYIMLKLYGDNVTVKSISIKGNNDESLAGKATVNASIDNTPTLTFDASATKEITLTFDTPVTLGITEETATTFWLVIPPTTFSKGITVTVKDDKNGEFTKSTTASLLVSRNTLKRLSALKTIMSTSISVPEAVDLGLPSGLKWASFNLGASKPEEYGDYYAWGEIEPYYSSLNPLTWKEGKEAGYNWPSYKWCMGSYNTITKYCTKSSVGYNGFTDGRIVLDPDDDAVHVNLGGKWRMPTDAEYKELINNSTSIWTVVNGVYGRRYTSRITGNSIFFPCAGVFGSSRIGLKEEDGFYWSSSLSERGSVEAGRLEFSSDWESISTSDRFSGYSIRPVYGETGLISATSITIDKANLTIPVDRIKKLTATILPENASNQYVL